MEKAVTSLEDWYDGTDNRVTALRETLAELKDREINPELPDISQSLSLLKGRIAGRHVNNEAQMDGDNSNGGDES